MTVKNVNNSSNTLRDVAKAVAENSMNATARELGRSERITNKVFPLMDHGNEEGSFR